MENSTWFICFLSSFPQVWFFALYLALSLIPSVLFLFSFLCCRWFHAVSIPLLSCDTDSLPEPRPRCWTPCSYSTESQYQGHDFLLHWVSALCKWMCVLPAHRKEVSGHYLMDSPFSTFSGHWQLFTSSSLLLVSWYLQETTLDDLHTARELCLTWRPYSQHRENRQRYEKVVMNKPSLCRGK